MKSVPSCPRCGRAVHEPNVWSSAWQCDAHGPVTPLQGVRSPTAVSLKLLIDAAKVPIWIPWPLPTGWVVTGFADVGDDRSGGVAIAVALSGPAPLGGIGEMVLVAEEPGIGLASRIAQFDGPDPGGGFDRDHPDARVRYDGHELHLWSVDAGKERAVYIGEAMANWLWIILQPADTGLIMCEINALRDLRDRKDGGVSLEPPFGAPSPFLAKVLRGRE